MSSIGRTGASSGASSFDSGASDALPAKLSSNAFKSDPDLQDVLDGYNNLGRGDKGAGLLKVQRGLQQLGHGLYEHGADGRWHNETRDAVVAFQTGHGLEGSGFVDAKTLATLDEVLAASTGALEGAAADGSISAPELKDAEAQMAAALGSPEKARSALIAALGQDPTKIDFDAVDYLQGNIGSMDKHIGRYQDVLSGHLKGAKLLDANFAGRLDANDLVFTEGADGQVNVEAIGQALCDRVKIGAAMIDGAYAMDKAEHRFGDLEFNEGAFQLEDPDDWENGMGVMIPADGVPASVALMDILNNPDFYQFECATALTIVRYKAIHDLIGAKDFDRICSDMRIGPWESDDHAKDSWLIDGAGAKGVENEATAEQIDMVKPGDYAYFSNWDVSKAGFEGGWQGENVVSLGDGLYYGHPFGVIAGSDIVSHLNENRKEGSTRSASLMDVRARIGASILSNDKDPYQ
ncbi:MAG: peptidoglycan-binding protein [Planctomycetota bacterium]|jgi:peptidoglycan hydrolase-like protein with peptidoglycan-binding domain